MSEHPRDRYFIFRVNPTEKRTVREAAKAAGKTVSDYIREKVLG